MSTNELNQFDPAEEELVAYLDGELEPAARQRVEQRLGTDAALREKLRRTQQAWDALDLLPHTRADESFANTTIQMTVSQVLQNSATSPLPSQKHFTAPYWPWLKIGSVAFAAMLLGFILTKASHNKNRQKELREAHMAESFEALSETPSLEFLIKLRDEKLFTTKSNDPS
jgi:anti-sigma factor RsiW